MLIYTWIATPFILLLQVFGSDKMKTTKQLPNENRRIGGTLAGPVVANSENKT